MKCPNCETSSFEPVLLEQDLHALRCTSCNGHWINSFQYWLWRDSNPENLPEKPASLDIVPEDRLAAKICPECFKILQRYKVGHGTNFEIDRCEVCRGTWFDKNEWEALKDRNLHDELHAVFSAHWQKAARDAMAEQNRARMLQQKLGHEDFEKAQLFRDWLSKHPERSTILAFLQYR